MKIGYHRIELGLGLLMLLASPFGSYLGAGHSWPITDVFRWSGVLILAQGLLRDVVLLVFYRHLIVAERAPSGFLICVESTVGAGLIGVYLLLFGMGAQGDITISNSVLLAVSGCLWLFGYFTRDFVLEMRKEENHLNLVLGFR
ncbi:MAG: hypothetical protein KDC35_05215 [Acidobacteria bacterium]|nr:hypothetical protein [Acidobacteriota bacterium]